MDEITEIYHVLFWNGTRCGELPSGLDVVMFNAACAGPGTAVRCLQRALGVKDDGIFGDIETMPAVRAVDPHDLLIRLTNELITWFDSRPAASLNPGWDRRARDAENLGASLVVKV